MEKIEKRKLRRWSWILFIVYLLLLFYLLFFSVNYGRTTEYQGYRYNLELFKEIKRFWLNKETLGWDSVLTNLAGNIVAFMPFGYCLAVLTKHGKNAILCGLGTGLFSLVVEVVQLVSRVGAFDVDDIFLNGIGGMLGCLAYFLIGRPVERFLEKEEKENNEEKARESL